MAITNTSTLQEIETAVQNTVANVSNNNRKQFATQLRKDLKIGVVTNNAISPFNLDSFTNVTESSRSPSLLAPQLRLASQSTSQETKEGAAGAAPIFAAPGAAPLLPAAPALLFPAAPATSPSVSTIFAPSVAPAEAKSATPVILNNLTEDDIQQMRTEIIKKIKEADQTKVGDPEKLELGNKLRRLSPAAVEQLKIDNLAGIQLYNLFKSLQYKYPKETAKRAFGMKPTIIPTLNYGGGTRRKTKKNKLNKKRRTRNARK